MIKKTLNIPVYDCKVIIIIKPDINEDYRRLCVRYKLDTNREDRVYAGVLAPPDSVHLYYILLGSDYLTVNKLVHEVTHLGNYILGNRGTVSVTEDEPMAYLNGYLAEEVHKLMVKHGIEFISPTQKTKLTK